MKRWRRCLLLLAPAMVGLTAADLDPGRFVTLDTGVIQPGTNELDLGVSAIRSIEIYDDHGGRRDRGGSRSQVVGTIGGIRGISPDLDVSLVAGWTGIHDEMNAMAGGRGRSSGLTDLQASARWRCLVAGTAEFAVVPIITAPTGNGRSRTDLPTSSDRWHAGGAIVETWYLGGRGVFGAHLRYDRLITEDAPSDQDAVNGSVAYGIQVLPWLQPEIEVTYNAIGWTGTGVPSSSLLMTCGAQVHPRDNVRVGAGGQLAIAGRSSDRTWSLITVAAIGF